MPINEWTFTADVKSWIDEIIRDRPELPFGASKVEERGKRSKRRRDLTLYDRSGSIVLTGEFKMPDNPKCQSPFQESLVSDAHEKADSMGVTYFFTCNVNRCVLWQTFEQGIPITERHIARWEVFTPSLRSSTDLEHPRAQDQFKRFLEDFLSRFAGIMTGAEAMPSLPLDEKFLLVWEDALQRPVQQTLKAISDLYEIDKPFTSALDKWMLGQQWVISHKDEEVIRDNLDRAAKFSCYMLANRIIFYKALRRRVHGMRALAISESVSTGAQLGEVLDGYFTHAIQMSRDYETIFSHDYGDTLPYLSDEAVDSWRELVKQTDPFDFTKINYEIIGQIFERMLSTAERHKFGQHYTRSEVVDLINAFCIRKSDAKVLDPAAGGGTFLVRAYRRKRDLSDGRLEHQELLEQLYGFDISAYPAHLTTVNLATRDLIDEANYPLVARKDFFHVHNPFSMYPSGRKRSIC